MIKLMLNALLVYAGSLLNPSLELSNYQILQESEYKFTFFNENPVSAGGKIILELDSAFKASNSFSCELLSPSSFQSCSFQDSIFTGILKENIQSSQTFLMKLGGVLNASPAKNFEVSLGTSDLLGNLIDNCTLTVSLNPLTLNYAEISSWSNICGEETEWNFTVEIEMALTDSGRIQVALPYWNFNLNPKTFENFYSDSTYCEPDCEINDNLLTIDIPSGFVGNFTFKIINIRNPPSTETVSGFKVSVYYSNGLYFYSYDLPINLTSTQPNTLENCQLKLSQLKVNSPSEYQFIFTTKNPIPYSSFIQIKFPETVTITGSQIEINQGIDNTNWNTNLNEKILTIEDFASGYKDSGLVLNFIVKNCNNPPSDHPAYIELKLGYNNSFTDVFLEFEIVAEPGIILSTVNAEDYSINFYTDYLFTLSSVEPVNKQYSVLIQFPEGISPNSESYYKANELTSQNAEMSIENKTIKLKNIFEDYIGTQAFSFYITTVRNPVSTKAVCCFSIKIFEDGNFLYEVSQNSTQDFKANPGIALMTATPESFITGECTSYEFSINITNVIPEEGSFSIQVPSELEIHFTTLKNVSGLNEDLVVDSYSLSQINISNCFHSNFSGVFQFTLDCVKNPPSFQESSSFILSTYSSGFVIDRVTEGITVQMTETHELQKFSVSSASDIVAKVTDFYFAFIPFNTLTSVFQVSVYPQSNFIFGKSIVCSSNDVTINFCSVINKVLIIEAKNKKNSEIKIKATNINNPPSTEPVLFKLLSSTGVYDIDSSSAYYRVSTPASFKSFAASLSPSYISVQSELTLSYSLSTAFPDSGAFVVSLSFISDSVKCYNNTLLVPCYFTDTLFIPGNFPKTSKIVLKNVENPELTGSYTINVTSYTNSNYLVESKVAELSITCKSPCKTCKSSADLCTSCDSSSTFPYFYNDYCYSTCKTGYYATVSKTCEPCSSPCSECLVSSKSCTACSSGYLYKNSCLDSCVSGTFPDSNKCTTCTLPCSTCDSSSICTSCTNPYTLYNSNCQLSCPDSFVKINKICVPCKDCLTCIVSTTTCTSCIKGNYLYENSCLSQCPDGTYILSDKCEKCSSSCMTCSGSPNYCTNCEIGWVLESNSCISQCSSAYYYSEGKCLNCEFPCKTCSSKEKCISCSDGLYLQSDQCVSACDKGYYVNENHCEPCPIACTSCYNSGFCIECTSSYYLFETSCVAECPTGYFDSSGLCISCENCQICDKVKGCLSTCENSKVYYQGNCLETCPAGTVELNKICVSCENCQECSESPTYCTLCPENLTFFNNLCVTSCPQGYISFNSTCVLNNLDLCSPGCTYSLLNNSVCDSLCNNQNCSYDNGLCSSELEKKETKYSDDFYVEQEPFVLTSLSVGAIGISAALSLTTGSSFLLISGAACGCLESMTKISMLACISQADGFKGRVLTTNDEKFSLIYGGLIGVLILHYLTNFSFILVYWKFIRKQDQLHKLWTQENKWGVFIILIFMYIFSFKIVLMQISNIPKIQVFNSKFNSETNLKRPLKYFQLLYILIVLLPFLFLCSMSLINFSPGSLTYTLALDCIVLEGLSLIFFIFILLQKSSGLPKSKYGVNKKGEEIVNTVVLTDALPDYSKRNQENSNIEEMEIENSDKMSSPEPTAEGTVIKSLSLTPSIIISKDRIMKRNFSFNVSNLLPKVIESEEQIDFEEFEVDLDDLRRCYLKLKGFNVMFPVLKDFYPPVVIDDDDQIIDIEINFSDYELIAIDPENPKIGEFRHKLYNTRVRMLRNFENTVIQSYYPSPESEITMRLENPFQSIYSSEELSNSPLKKISNTVLFRSGTPPKGTSARSLPQHPGLNLSQDSIN